MIKKLFLALLILVCLSISAFSFAQKKEYQIHAFAFYNLENLFHPSNDPNKFDDDFTPTGSYRYTEAIYQKKLHNMAYALSQIAIDKIPGGPALIGVAEVENEQVLQDLIAQPELEKRKLRIVHFDSPDSRGIDVALLYQPQYFKVFHAKALPVPLIENGRKIRTRDVLYIMGKLGNDTIHVLVNHWPSRFGGEEVSSWKREKAAAVNREVIDSLVNLNPNVKIIVMGDLNDDPNNASITRTLGAVGTISKLKSGGLYNPWMSFHKKGLGTLAYKDNWNLFDQIIVSYGFIKAKSDGWKYQSAEIFNKKFLLTQFGKFKGYPHRSYSGTKWIDGYSDHLPAIIYLIKKL